MKNIAFLFTLVFLLFSGCGQMSPNPWSISEGPVSAASPKTADDGLRVELICNQISVNELQNDVNRWLKNHCQNIEIVYLRQSGQYIPSVMIAYKPSSVLQTKMTQVEIFCNQYSVSSLQDAVNDWLENNSQSYEITNIDHSGKYIPTIMVTYLK